MVGIVVIRPMSVEDIDACLRIEQATYPTPWTEGIFRDELVGQGRAYLVAESGNGIVGYGGLLLVIPEAHVTTVTVAPDHRGGRVGTRLMLNLTTTALEAGATSLTLEVRLSNRQAQALYQRFGMAPVGVRKRYYRDEDALVMWVHDIDSDEYRARLDQIRMALT
jgi:[ribosomal protein S18]-alanine N-acetyltransferase